jgi:hypothetical protein
MIADSFPVRERPSAYGVYAIGASIGAAIDLPGRLRMADPACSPAWRSGISSSY